MLTLLLGFLPLITLLLVSLSQKREICFAYLSFLFYRTVRDEKRAPNAVSGVKRGLGERSGGPFVKREESPVVEALIYFVRCRDLK